MSPRRKTTTPAKQEVTPVTPRAARYEGNPKHKEPWQVGRRGSLCPKGIDLRKAQELLAGSFPYRSQRYAALDGRLYAAKEHRDGRWHGHPLGWSEAPPVVRHHFETVGGIKRSVMSENW